MQPLENIDSHKIKKHGMKLPQPTRTCTFLHDHKAEISKIHMQPVWLKRSDYS